MRFLNVDLSESLFEIQAQLISLIIVTVVIVGVFLLYYFKQRKQDVIKKERHGFVLFIDSFLQYMDNLVVDVMGPQFRWFTPYAIYLILYIGIGNLFDIIGWQEPLTSYTITFMLGIVTFVGIYITGIFYQRWNFILKFIKNPIDLIGQFSPLISITFRIFGNLIAGTVILFLFYTLTSNITKSVPVIGYVDLLGGLISPILNLYFDLFDALVQTYIFVLLSLSYIGIEAEHKASDHKSSQINKKIKREIYFFKDKSKKIIDEDIDIVRKPI